LINDYWNSAPYTPAGVVAAGTIYDEIVERSKVEKLPFPPALSKLNKMLSGGINYGYIVNILAGSGCGKSSLVNSCITHYMTVCEKKVLVCSLEAEASEFGENLLSSVMQRKIAMIEDREEKIAFVSSDAAKEAAKNLFLFPDGTPRLYLLDDRGDFSKLQEKIEECVTMHDIKIVVIDVISDVFSGATLEEVDKWMKWEKNLVKSTNCILIQVAHTKKPSGGTKAASEGGKINEEMLIGSGTQFRSAGINIALQRDKSHDDPVMRNTTEVFLLKSRATGITGKALELYYDNDTATLWDKEVYQEQFPAEF
jgi:archaellum biogenesis ATPase FlaH